ncbi:sigma-54 dependent transcriptional regulator [Lentimicrobium sp.]|jgi:two-component system response regulator HydG|uniref:sigma-54-dependent transcriptional regulator n=1 Tax=Lentimicrobium sp. TaxID=2034841 RepID=UPI0025D8C4CA|nr:sigma-54 dependent transcriptional regulator [Lentimicrobium sp.]MCO5256964.1 sigma-54 dependent transcriptional regulator [Lentimicrobium sp.]HPF65792.1 sigma-54 dependent transcriptional regulator [Lentimicrobium sp.]HPJ63872.1 sigma-54 dependent transcriptional regulator [Lentimicrobium sp.]HPR26459.1 sigma-54 dependent transcriptional regulator [Lentimicrobium sp.]HRW70488.1 sigma-54 dependent transcriptional regulator [Lentimicrobium sp.]
MYKVLIVDDDPTFCLMLKSYLGNKGFDVKEVFTAGSAIKASRAQHFDIILTDFRLPDIDGITLIAELKKIQHGVPVVLMTRYGDIRSAVTAIKSGAFDYITKPVNPDELLLTVNKAISKQKQEKKNESGIRSEPLPGNMSYLRGTSQPAMLVEQYISLIAPTDMSVIIQGESGTGKEYVARMIHMKSQRSSKPFIAVDCGALTNELAASELFGHTRGSFTDAHADKEGQFQQANGGTLFLDEIGNLSYENQIKLLRATQERKVRKLGGTRDVEVDVRIIVATNDDLAAAVQKGSFREDLFHRLNEFKINIPPLRNRGEDIIHFAGYFLENANLELNKNIIGFEKDVIETILKYPWPGNIRELKNVVKRAVLLATTGMITRADLPPEIPSPGSAPSPAGIFQPPTTDLKSMAETQEKTTIINVLKEVHYNKSKAARLLNIDRKTLYNKMKLYGIEG